MATITGSTASSYWTHKLEVTENSVNKSNNTSSVTVDVYIGRGATAGASYMTGANISVTIKMTGCTDQTFTYKNSNRVDVAQGAWLKLGSVTFDSVPHDSDGSKTVTISSSFTNTISPASGSASGTMALTRTAYTVSYNANGGLGAPSAQTKYYGTTLTLSNTNPTKSNYTFLGWNTSSTATGSQYNAGSSYTANSDATLYAIWRAPVTLTYNANGGSGQPGNTNDYVYNSTTSKSLTVSSASPTRTGCTFKGWSTSSTATTASYQAGSSVSVNANSTVTLYAVWSANVYTNTIQHWRYVGTGGNNGNGTMYRDSAEDTTFTGAYNANVTIPSNHVKTYTGYHNTGIANSTWGYDWSTKDIGSTFSQPIGGITIEYYYNPNEYTVTFDANEGSCSTSTKTVQYNITYGTLPTPTRTGYTFKGWYTSTSSGAKIETTTKYSLTSNQTLYAQWSANSYIVTFNANGGTTPTASKSVTYDSTYGTLPTPTKDGHIFNGWYTATSDGNKIQTSTKVAITANQTLYAQWTPWSHTVTYNVNGGSSTAPASQTKTYGETITISSTVPTRSGYTFVCWNTKADGTGTTYNSGQTYSFEQDGGAVTLYAIWKHANVVYWKIDDEYVLCNIYVKLDNEWKPCLCYIKMDDEWKLSVN